MPHFKGPRFGAFAFHINGNLFPSLWFLVYICN
jgi:hypothetical protein